MAVPVAAVAPPGSRAVFEAGAPQRLFDVRSPSSIPTLNAFYYTAGLRP